MLCAEGLLAFLFLLHPGGAGSVGGRIKCPRNVVSREPWEQPLPQLGGAREVGAAVCPCRTSWRLPPTFPAEQPPCCPCTAPHRKACPSQCPGKQQPGSSFKAYLDPPGSRLPDPPCTRWPGACCPPTPLLGWQGNKPVRQRLRPPG